MFPQYVVGLYDQNGNLLEEWSPGLLGFNIMKNGDTWATSSFQAEVKIAVSGGAW
jgi:hypothetical protein